MTESAYVATGPATVVLGLGAMVSHGFGLSLVPALLPQIEATFASGFGALGLAVATGLLAYAMGGLLASRVLDWMPNRTVLNGTFLLTSLSLAGASFATSPSLIAPSVIMLGVAAPVSWAATAHATSRSVEPQSRNLVMGGAAGGVGLGVIVNGTLLRVFSTPAGWRTSFLVAAGISILVTVASVAVFREPVERPSAGLGKQAGRGSYRVLLRTWPGRVVVASSAIAGVSSYTFITYLTTTAIVEMGSGPTAAGALLWLMGILGIISSLFIGRLGDRASPLLAVGAIFLVCAAGLAFLSVFWAYPGLVVASVGMAVLNYPIWGLVAGIAMRRFDAPVALRAVALGLVGAALLAAISSVVTGAWLDLVGSMRLPVLVVTAMTSGVGLWLARLYRRAPSRAVLD